ncbi:MAG: DegT/DnrJ/EryC1/StrS aminotransferase family protein [Candidatus Omnitrophica bacterium]|nr:DegT/DnrJ/EryC1/StrS aminotransferase family protein [Candidatus Omnitrophota bacterium]
MSIFREIPPTAGFTLGAQELFSPLFNRNAPGSFEEDFRKYLGLPYARITYSGTAAFFNILQALKKISQKRTVIIPAFICPLIPLAVKRAGLNLKICDINPDNLDFDHKQLREICAQDDDVLAILATHLAGIPVDLDKIKEAAKNSRAFVIEDCAQSLGAEYQEKKVGSIGDFSFFSLCRGKGMTIYEGGVIAAKNPEYFPMIDAQLKENENIAPLSEALKIIELYGYSFMYRPFFFWWAFRLPQLYWLARGDKIKAAGDYFTEDFPLQRVSELRKRVGHFQFNRLDKEIVQQRAKAEIYIEGLKGNADIKPITEIAGTLSTYPFLTILFDDAEKRNAALNILAKTGLGISQIYAYALPDYGYLQNIRPGQTTPNARSLATRHITLSTNSQLKTCELKKVITKIKEL